MPQKFFTSNIESDFIEQLLNKTPIPTIDIVSKGDMVYEGFNYIYDGNVVKCKRSGFVDPYWFDVIGKEEDAQTDTFFSTVNFYDQKTHKRLGKYLRYYRDKTGVDLMPFYNCFNYDNFTDFYLDTGAEGGYVIGKRENYKVLSVPIKMNKKYTIAIECPTEVLVKPVFHSDFGMVLSTSLQVMSEKIKVRSDNGMPVSVVSYNCTSFGSPKLFSCDLIADKNISLEECYDKERYLYLAIQLPKSNNSSVVVIEGDYTKNYEKIFDANYSRMRPGYTKSILVKDSQIEFDYTTEKGAPIIYMSISAENVVDDRFCIYSTPNNKYYYVHNNIWGSYDSKNSGGLVISVVETPKVLSDGSNLVVDSGDFYPVCYPSDNPSFHFTENDIYTEEYYDGVPSAQKQNELMYKNLSLLLYSDGTSYAYADRLIEYLLLNAITQEETIDSNIGYVQRNIGAETFKNYTKDVWSDNMRAALWYKYRDEHPDMYDNTGEINQNLFNEYDCSDNYKIGEGGAMVADSAKCVSNFIPVFWDTISINFASNYWFYDENKNPIEDGGVSDKSSTLYRQYPDKDMHYHIPTNAVYFKFDYKKSDATDKIMAVAGYYEESDFPSYSPYSMYGKCFSPTPIVGSDVNGFVDKDIESTFERG